MRSSLTNPTNSLLALLLIPSLAFSQVPIKRGEPSPVDGWVFTAEQEKKIRFRLVEADFIESQLSLQKQLAEDLKRLAVANNELAAHYQKAFEAESDAHLKTLKRSTRSGWVYFLLGAGLTIAGGLALGYSAKALK